MKIFNLCGVVIALWLSSCSAGNQPSAQLPPTKGKPDTSKMEKISNAVYDGQSVTVTVVSHGCTKASHFAVEHQVVNGQCELTVVRNEPDRCRRAATPITVGIAWSTPADCTDLPLVFANPVLAIQNRAAELQIKRD